MLPQARALERADADNREGKDETVRTRGRDPLKPVVTALPATPGRHDLGLGESVSETGSRPAISQELVRFDMQKMENPEISGAEYRQGILAGYEVREYLLEKWGRTCAYCGKTEVPLEVDHIRPRSKGGSDRISNLTLSCRPCNEKKRNHPVEAFLAKKPEVLSRILAKAKAPLRDAAAVNATRWALFRSLTQTGLPVEQASGGRTKWNRTRFGLPKTHSLDAACVGNVDRVEDGNRPILSIKATGRGSYRRTRLDAFGFPRGFLTRKKAHCGFVTGDLVKAVVTTGKKIGSYLGRVAVRSSGSFNIQRTGTVVQGISHKACRRLQQADGYGYAVETMKRKESAFLPGVNAEVGSRAEDEATRRSMGGEPESEKRRRNRQGSSGPCHSEHIPGGSRTRNCRDPAAHDSIPSVLRSIENPDPCQGSPAEGMFRRYRTDSRN